MISEFFKRLFCRHGSWKCRIIHGDEINFMGGVRTIMTCTFCGKRKFYKRILK